ncbi:MAG: hypothetical protein KZQ83_14765 [gamma proteobacterium symbiont of Taylorina sp.]|nr:hypothetical protein [gamma proteobacterium symbiont of Taylorina sp.]
MNTTNPITLKPHVNHHQLYALEDSGIQLIRVLDQVIANCKTAAEEERVNKVNRSNCEQLQDDYCCGQSV